VDCEDCCPVEAVQAIYGRVRAIAELAKKPLGITFFCREYEAMFLANADHIAKRSKSIIIDTTSLQAGGGFTKLRNAKGLLKTIIATRKYKETRDQPRLTGAMDVLQCAAAYRPLNHLLKVIDWIYSWDGTRTCY
jgi:hypothetical protein